MSRLFPALRSDLRFFLGLLVVVILAVEVPALGAPTPTGLWLTQDREGVILIFPCGGALCGQIAGVFLDHPTDPTPVDHEGASQCHLPLIIDARPLRPGVWKGHIRDPRNGHVFGAEFHLDVQGQLHLRGFLGVPLLGETQIWTRYHGAVPSDCRIIARAGVDGGGRNLLTRGNGAK